MKLLPILVTAATPEQRRAARTYFASSRLYHATIVSSVLDWEIRLAEGFAATTINVCAPRQPGEKPHNYFEPRDPDHARGLLVPFMYAHDYEANSLVLKQEYTDGMGRYYWGAPELLNRGKPLSTTAAWKTVEDAFGSVYGHDHIRSLYEATRSVTLARNRLRAAEKMQQVRSRTVLKGYGLPQPTPTIDDIVRTD